MSRHVLVISYVPCYNRQGYDFAECLRSLGYSVRLFQMNGKTNREYGITGVSCIKPYGRMHKIHVMFNLLHFLLKTVFVRKQIVVCIGKPPLVLGGVYHALFGSKLIWYSLEYSKLGVIDRFVYKHCVAGYIDVEENRRDAIFAEYGRKADSLVCYNMPHLHSRVCRGGRLRRYLKDKYRVDENAKLVAYAGSYQKYACLEQIIAASRSFERSMWLILMAYGIPKELKAQSENCIVVPPVLGEEFYEWLADVDCALLPYESIDDFNVKNCSPQKIFDCYCVGVPYVASDRPIIEKVLSECPEVGLLCDFTEVNDICAKVDEAIVRRGAIREKMRDLHRSKFNYGCMRGAISKFVENVDV